MNAGQSIAAIRESKGWNQTQLADAVGVTQASVSQIENGERRISKELAERFSIALGVAMPKDILKDLLYKKIKQLSPKAAGHIMEIVDLILKGEKRP